VAGQLIRRPLELLQPPIDPTPADPKIREHLDYLKDMAARGVVPSELAKRARVVWFVVGVETEGRMPVPAAAAFPGGPIEYHWSVDLHRMSVEIPADGLCHWFYKNTETGEVWGREVPFDDGLPGLLQQYLNRVIASARP
jgi:hypothetical protein